ncbi:MAG: hypothetical protein DHS80DRAFT_20960 [Piptocephalis tieghemiana]|nr:MAG: hypothetical protein DHS80DRAFT_20960 [Piptocephalis tieghemiana]
MHQSSEPSLSQSPPALPSQQDMVIPVSMTMMEVVVVAAAFDIVIAIACLTLGQVNVATPTFQFFDPHQATPDLMSFREEKNLPELLILHAPKRKSRLSEERKRELRLL